MQMYKISLQNRIYKSDTNQKMAEPILNKMMTGRANKADACSNWITKSLDCYTSNQRQWENFQIKY